MVLAAVVGAGRSRPGTRGPGTGRDDLAIEASADLASTPLVQGEHPVRVSVRPPRGPVPRMP